MAIATADIHERAERALIHERPRAQQGRMEAMIVSDFDFRPVALGSLLDGKKLGRAAPGRLLDQRVLAGPHRGEADLGQAVVLGGDHHDIHVAIHHVVPIRRRLGPDLPGQRPRAGDIDIGNQHHGVTARGRGALAADQPASHDTDLHGSLPQSMPRSLGTTRRSV